MWLLLYGSYALSRPSLADGPGTMHAEIAREMVTRNDWTNSYANGVPVHSSSKALDWAIAASYKIFGVADWSARLPMALCILALAVTVFFFARTMFGWNAAGLYAALFLLTWPGTFLATRDLTPAPVLCLATTLVAFLLWHFLMVKKLTGGSAVVVSAMACALMLLAGSWPAVGLPLAIALACWLARRRPEPAKQAELPLLVWVAAALVLAGLLETQPGNPMAWIGPVPPVAMLIGGWLANNEAFADKKSRLLTAYCIFAVGIGLGLIAIFLGFNRGFDPAFHYRSDAFVLSAGRVSLFIAAAALITGGTGHLVFRLRNRIRIANCFLTGTLAGLIIAIQVWLVMVSPISSSQILADAIRPELNPTDVVVIDGKYPDASSFAFYLERPVLLALPAGSPGPAFVPALPDGVVAVDAAWAGATRVYLWTSASRPFRVSGPSYVVAASGGKEILSNQANTGGAAF